MIRTHKRARWQSFSKALEADHVVIPWLITHLRVRYLTRAHGKPYRKGLLILGECVFYFLQDRTRGTANKLEAKFLHGVSRAEVGNQRDVQRHGDR